MKRIISLLLAILMLTVGVSVSAYSTKDFRNGDVDMNGVTDVNDVTAIQKQLAEMVYINPEQKVLADTDSDGKVSIMDATRIQKTLIGTTSLTDEKKEVSYEISDNINIYFTNISRWSDVYFYFYNSETQKSETTWPGRKITDYIPETSSIKTYFAQVNVKEYNRVVFNDGANRQTVNIPVNKASSGFKISGAANPKALRVATFAYRNSKRGKTVTTNLNYSAGYDKKIWIWTPADYNPSATDKYKTIYIMDGQNLFEDHKDGYGGWQVIDGIESMMANGGRGVILVGIDNGNNKRDSELTPNIGTPVSQYVGNYSNGTGEAFGNFVADKVMPYVQENYNSSAAPEDNIIAGASSGGIEAFYIGIEHRDKFGGIGALSPAFILFGNQTWNNYLSKFDFTQDDMPMLYIFNGKNDSLEAQLYVGAVEMNTRLLSMGYNKDKITIVLEDGFEHNEAFWRIIFPDMVDWINGL